MLGTCPDIAFTMEALSKYTSNPGKVHWNEVFHMLYYLGGTKNLALVFDGSKNADMSSLIFRFQLGWRHRHSLVHRWICFLCLWHYNNCQHQRHL